MSKYARDTKVKGQVRHEKWYPHAPERVWVAITDPKAVAEWLMPNNIKAELGHRFRFETDAFPMMKMSGVTECEVIECDPPRVFAYSWRILMKEGVTRDTGVMVMRWELFPEEGGTRLVMTQSGIEKLPWIYRFMMTSGWGTMFKRWLPKIIDRVDESSGSFSPGAIPLDKRCYKVKTISDEMIY